MDPQETSPVPNGETAEAQVATTQEVKTPTAEEQLKTLQTQLAERDKIIKEREDSYKGLQRSYNKTSEELKSKSDLRNELADLRETQKIQAAMIAEYLGKQPESLDEDAKTRKPDLLAKFNQMETEQKAKRAAQEYNQQANEIWAKAQALGLPENDDSLLDIEDYLRAGNLKRAQAKVAKLEGAKTPVVTPVTSAPEKKESDDDKINRLVSERLNKIMEEKGLLKTDTAVPSGRAASSDDIIKRFSEGDPSVSESDYLKATGRG